jgi:hypothetical protein
VLSTALGTLEHGSRGSRCVVQAELEEGFKHDPYKKRDTYKDSLRDEGAQEFERQNDGFLCQASHFF